MKDKQISIIGVPADFGQSRRGVDMGPSAIRYAGVEDRLHELVKEIRDEGDIPLETELPRHQSGTNLKNLPAVTDGNRKLAEKVSDSVKEGRFPLVLGGDHSIAIGTLAGLSEHYSNLGVIWYDAHTDLNTAETSPSGNIHGMPLAVAMGLGHEDLTSIGNGPKVKPENIVVIGARSVDPGERELVKEKGIKVYTMHEIDRDGMTAVMEDALRYLESRGVDGIHLSLDLDGLDPLYTPGVGTPVQGGISYRESHLAMEMLHSSGKITSAEFVEVNPILDERNKTADVAVGLMGSLFGETLI
ncbi:arginase [Edaphobacillus lindanitolerans]|uniref:Arginase n=1 Tax=Edaphobacillus lindanitolerans TaxID=550447 RepID=A0A1U7PPD3_9BACI|nr:arginase [Edaphobacillus lindanitolerans]SIT88109.1 arginase [Edaphobacillus lindanitolerans]